MDENGHETRPHTIFGDRIALANPDGDLFWRSSPPGTWAAYHPFEAATWPDLEQFNSWREEQSDDLRRWLRAEQWGPVILSATARPVPVRVEMEV